MTKVSLTNSPTPLTANLDAAYSFNFLAMPEIKIADKKLIGKVTVKSATGASLCSGEISPDGSGACSATFTGSPRTETVTLAYEGRGGYVDSIGTADLKLVSPNGMHWAGTYRASSCTPLPADNGAGQWYFAAPCASLGPTFSFDGNFYFNDNSGIVILGGQGDTVRSVSPLGWNSKSNDFSFSLATGYRLIGGRTINGLEAEITASGTRTTTFHVTNRTTTTLSGTFHITAVSGYPTVTSLNILEYWKVIPTVADGTWSAALINNPGPQTKMNGYDFCFSNNQAVNQMSFDGPGNPRVRPSWLGGFVDNGCQFK